jgi:hypothetical protein
VGTKLPIQPDGAPKTVANMSNRGRDATSTVPKLQIGMGTHLGFNFRRGPQTDMEHLGY